MLRKVKLLFRKGWEGFLQFSLTVAQPFLWLFQRIDANWQRQGLLLVLFLLAAYLPLGLREILGDTAGAFLQLPIGVAIFIAAQSLAVLYFLVEKDLEGIANGFLYRPKDNKQAGREDKHRPIAKYVYLEDKVSLRFLLIACIGMIFGFTLISESLCLIGFTGWYSYSGEITGQLPSTWNWLLYTLLSVFRAIDIFDTLQTFNVGVMAIQHVAFPSAALVFVFKGMIDLILLSKIRSWWQRRLLVREAIRALRYDQTRDSASNTLVRVGNRAIASLKSALKHSKSWRIRSKLVETLGKLQDPRSTETLLHVFKNDPELFVRAQAALALGDINYDRVENERKSQELRMAAITALLHCYRDEEQEPEIRANAARSLGKLQAKEAVEELFNALDKYHSSVNVGGSVQAENEDEDDFLVSVQAGAIWALGNMGPRLLGAHRTQTAIQAFASLLRDETISSRTHSSAAFALGKMSELLAEGAQKSEIIDILWDVLNSDTTVEVRYETAIAMMQFGEDYVSDELSQLGARAIPIFIKMLGQHSSEDIRGNSALALGRLRAREAIPALLESFRLDGAGNDSSSYVRACAAKALGLLGAREALPALFDAVRADTPGYDESEMVQAYAFWSLGRMGERKIIPLLLKVLSEEGSEDLRSNAAKALGLLGGKRNTPSWMKKEISEALFEALLSDDDDDFAYFEDDDDEDEDGEETSTDNPDSSEEEQVSWDDVDWEEEEEEWVGEDGEEEEEENYVEAEDVGRSAAWAIGNMKAVLLIPRLIKTLGEEQPMHVHANAIRALAKLKATEAIPAIQKARSLDDDLREAADAALESLSHH